MKNISYLYEGNEDFKHIQYTIYTLKEKYTNEIKQASIINITNILNNEFETLIKEYNFTYIQIAFIKKLLQTWINNLNDFNKYIFTGIDLLFCIYDVKYFINEDHEIEHYYNYNIIDGNHSCDLSLNLILLHIVIKHLLIFITEKYDTFQVICNRILQNFRIIQTKKEFKSF